jgi:hypothetical protein
LEPDVPEVALLALSNYCLQSRPSGPECAAGSQWVFHYCTLEAMRTQGAFPPRRKNSTATLTILKQRRLAAALALTF